MSANASSKVAKKIALFEIRPPGTEQQCRLKRKHAIRRKRYIRERRSISNDMSYSIHSIDPNSDSEIVEKVSSEFSASCSALQLVDQSNYNNYDGNDGNNESVQKTPSKLLRSSSVDDFINLSRDRDKKSNYLHFVDINIEEDTHLSTGHFSFNHDVNGQDEILYENAKPEILSVSDHFKVNRLNDRNNEMNSPSTITNYSYDSGTHSHSNSQLSNYSREMKAENFYENIVPRYLLSVTSANQLPHQHDIHEEKESSSVKRKSGLEIIQSLMLSMGGPPRITGSSEDIYTNAALSESDRIKSNSDPEAVGRLTDEDEPLYEDLYDYYMSSCCSDGNCESSHTNKYNNNNKKSVDDVTTVRSTSTTNIILKKPMTIVPPTIILLDEYSRNSSKDKKDPDVPTPCSSRPPTPPPYESLYSEPIYGETGAPNTIINSSHPSLYNNSQKSLNFPHSSSSSTSNYGESNNLASKSRIISTTVRKDSIYHPSVASSSGSNTSGGFYNDSVSGIYGFNDKLPPTPPNKFSSIAKSAGRKIAKRFLQIRRISRTSLENLESPALSLSSSTSGNSSAYRDIRLRTNAESPYSNNSSSNSTSSSSGVKDLRDNKEPIRRVISRPSIPPPEPPKIQVNNAKPNSDNLNEINIGDSNRRNEESNSIYRSYAHSLKSSQNQEADDYDDSDFYDSDSDLIRNFVSQVQPIYSMEEEPLYQYYTYGISSKPEDDYQPVIPKNLGLTLDMLVPRVGQRTLWCELPEVMASGILAILSDKQKQLQEAIFEILTSEVSYIKSLDVLISLFYKHEELVGVLTEEERGYLFGNITEVKDCAQAFLAELLGKWEESWYIQEIGEIVNRNANTRFTVYMDYCRNKPYQDKTMQRLRHSRDEFVSVIKTIEEDPKCQMLRMDSFLMLPMQRITRLPLLVNAVIQRTQSAKEKAHCEEALKNLTNLVLACNDAARESQDAEETAAIVDKIEFPRGLKNNYNMGQFVMKGDFMKNPFDQGRGQLNWTFRKTKRTFYWLLLFHNQLLITKKKANGRYEVLDIVLPSDSSIKPLPNLEGVSKDFQHFFMLHFNRKETVYFLAARTNSEVERWKSKLETMKTSKDLKVEAIFPYDARREDELSFHVGDLIQVSQMQPDGWYYGTKLDNGKVGWFPGNYCCEV